MTNPNEICECGHMKNQHRFYIGECYCKVDGCPCKKFKPLAYDYKNSDYNRMEDDEPVKEEICSKCGKDLSNDPDWHYSGYCALQTNIGKIPKPQSQAGLNMDAPKKEVEMVKHSPDTRKGSDDVYKKSIIGLLDKLKQKDAEIIMLQKQVADCNDGLLLYEKKIAELSEEKADSLRSKNREAKK